MLLEKGKKIALVVGTAVLPGLVVGSLFVTANTSLKLSKADTYNITLNSNNQPTLTNGEGSLVDDKNVTWEYHNASSNANGHITLNSDSYFGVSSTTDWGITAIGSVTANFTIGSGSEGLWLLKSTDGVTWHECEILTSGQASTSANNWRYIRFYNYQSTVNISSVSIGYSCTGTTPTEDVDSAHASNVIATTGLSYATETTDLSPNSVDGEAVRFTKTGSSSTDLTIGFGKTYTLGEVAYSKIEFDIWTTRIDYGRTISLMKDTTSIQSIANTNNTNSYVWTSLGNDWYHAEIPMTFFFSLISGYGDKDVPTKNIDKKEFNAIKINQGNCIVDNLRIGSSSCDLGIFNGTTYKPSVGEIYWVKVSWVGKLHPSECSITFSDNSLARYIPSSDPNLLHESPFYVELLGSGSLTYTAYVSCGYDHRVQTIQKTITII